jgi:hypothetical protein
MAQEPLVGQGLIIEASRPHSVRLLWKSDQLVAENSTWQHTTLTTDRHSCPRRESNPQSQQPRRGRRPRPQTAQILPYGQKFYSLDIYPQYRARYAHAIRIAPHQPDCRHLHIVQTHRHFSQLQTSLHGVNKFCNHKTNKQRGYIIQYLYKMSFVWAHTEKIVGVTKYKRINSKASPIVTGKKRGTLLNLVKGQWRSVRNWAIRPQKITMIPRPCGRPLFQWDASWNADEYPLISIYISESRIQRF